MSATLERLTKLHIGCRTVRIPGFLNVDIRADRNPDIAADAQDLNMIESESLDEVYSSQVLEHFSLLKTVDVLKEWNRVLKKGGILWLSVPDFECIHRIYVKYKTLPIWSLYHMYGEQHHEHAWHYTIFTWHNLQENLMDAGFSKFQKIKELPYGTDDCSYSRDSWEGELISLNVKAVK